MPPDPPSKAHGHAQHVASRHANFQIRKKNSWPPLPNPGDAPDSREPQCHNFSLTNIIPQCALRWCAPSTTMSFCQCDLRWCTPSTAMSFCQCALRWCTPSTTMSFCQCALRWCTPSSTMSFCQCTLRWCTPSTTISFCQCAITTTTMLSGSNCKRRSF